MMTELCAELRNYFVADTEFDIIVGDFTVSGGTITPLSLQDGQYFRIIGSTFNDGVWNTSDIATLHDETFHGAIWRMSVPPAVVALDADITAWMTANQSVVESPYQSESFAGYTYSLKSGDGGGAASDLPASSWQSVFAARLKPYRKRVAVI